MATPEDCPMVKTDDYEGSDRRQWHLDKTVNIGHLLTTITMVATLLVVLSKFDTRVTVLEQHIEYQKQTNAQHSQADNELKSALREGLEKIDQKLDKIMWSDKK